jgi:hypothetical protein
VDTNVSEGYAASIFRVKMCRISNQMDYTSRLHGGWSLRSTGRGHEINPIWYNRNSEKEDGSFQGHRACLSEMSVSTYVTTYTSQPRKLHAEFQLQYSNFLV